MTATQLPKLIVRETVQELEPCPFCGNKPHFFGDVTDWKDDHRYVELSLGCCAMMTEGIGWRKARDMTVEARNTDLRDRLSANWNRRVVPEAPPTEAGKQDPPSSQPNPNSPEAWIVVMEYAWDLGDGKKPVLSYLWPSEFNRKVYASADEASKFIKDNDLPIGWVTMQLRIP